MKSLKYGAHAIIWEYLQLFNKLHGGINPRARIEAHPIREPVSAKTSTAAGSVKDAVWDAIISKTENT